MQTVSETLTLPFAKYVKYPFRDIRSLMTVELLSVKWQSKGRIQDISYDKF